jgi:hypothetical protein
METASIERYASLKRDLLQCIDHMLALENIRGCPCEDW